MKNNFTKFKSGLVAAMLAFGFTEAATAQTLLSESFTNPGIPTGWTNVVSKGTVGFIRETDGTSNSGTQFAGTFNGPTKANGYLLYDSDDNANAAGDSVVLTTTAINATGKNNVFLKFNEFYGEFNSKAYVQVSNNGTTWTTVHTTDTGLAANQVTTNPNLVNVNLSSVAANQATVYVRFIYSSTAAGGSYWWFIDDVEVYAPVAGAVDLGVSNIYALGKLPLSANTTGRAITARITNPGTSLVTSETVTLNITGANTYTATATVTNLAPGLTQNVTFTGFIPTTAGTDTIRVSVPNDLNNANNTQTYLQAVTTSTISHAVGNPPTGTSLTGLQGTGAFYAKFSTNKPTATTIPVVRALIASAGPPAVSTVGQTLYAVVLDATGNLLGRSADRVITAADLSTGGLGMIEFPLRTPITLDPNADFFVGLAQVGGGYFPLITQPETPVRPGTFFIGSVTGGTLTPSSQAVRYVLEADLVTPPTTLNDASVEAVYSLGKVSLTPGGNVSKVQAIVKNTGTTILTNIAVRATVSTSTYNNTVTVSGLAPGETELVTFPNYTANTPMNTKNLTVSLPADDNVNNNTLVTPITITAATQGYAVGTLADSYVSWPGSGTGSNQAFLVRLNTTGNIKVNTVRAFIRDNAAVVGRTVYAVVVDSMGNEIGRSANVTFTTGDLGIMRPFPITIPPAIRNASYYVGIAIPPYTGTRVDFLGVQFETPEREEAYYAWPLAATTPTKPIEVGAERRFMIEADVANITGVKEEINASLVSVYPNPSNGVFNISAAAMKGANMNMEVRDLQGKLVYSAAASKDNASVNLKNVAAGVYMLKVSTDSEVAVKRLIVK